jgi:hypothetical protein
VGNVYPDDYDSSDNYAEMPVIVSGMDSNGGVSVAAQFSSFGTKQTVLIPAGVVADTITSFATSTTRSVMSLPVTTNYPAQGSVVTIVFFHSFSGPFDLSALVTTTGSPDGNPAGLAARDTVGSFSLTGLPLDPSALKGATSARPARGEICTPMYRSTGAVKYTAQVCVTSDPDIPTRNKTEYRFEFSAGLDPNATGWFVPFGNSLTFNADMVASFGRDAAGNPTPRMHYRIPLQDVELFTTTTGQAAPTCIRFAVPNRDGSLAKCAFYPGGGTTSAPDGAKKDVAPIVGTPN